MQWIHRFEVCQKLFPKLNPKDLVNFLDEITFAEQAIDTIPVNIRLSMASRTLKYFRQEIVQKDKKKTEQW